MSAPAALVRAVEPGSPADDAGFTPGCQVTSANGHVLHDIIDWRWHADGGTVVVGYVDTDGDVGEAMLEREPGQDWGLEFDDVLFDGARQCCNRCTFCFMRQLPEGVRPSLTLRDDDFRLSFLQGNFVTFTNLEPHDERRIVEQRISPLRYSLHAVDATLRAQMIGPLAQRGLEAAERLLDAGIELHAQIVLMPGVNDGDRLRETLAWAYGHEGVLNVAIVPLGYTKYQQQFSESFQSRDAALQVLDDVRPFQERALAERGIGWVYPADEFYRNAYPETLLEHVPDAAFYGDFGMFEDGIGMVRSFIDDWNASVREQEALASALARHSARIALVAGCAQREFLSPLVKQSPLAGLLEPLYVENRYFGGNVDVTGLLCGCDVAPALKSLDGAYAFAAVPAVLFNSDGLMLDDTTIVQLRQQAELPVHVVSCEASKFMPHMQALIEEGGASCRSIS